MFYRKYTFYMFLFIVTSYLLLVLKPIASSGILVRFLVSFDFSSESRSVAQGCEPPADRVISTAGGHLGHSYPLPTFINYDY